MRKIIVVILNLILGVTVAHALGEYPITITGSTPASGESISSFDNITLHFDFSKFYESPDIDENGNWGVCTSATEGIREIQLFKGTPDNGEILSTLCESISYTSDKLVPGTDFNFSFPGQAVEPGQIYTVKITYGFFASEPGVNNKKARQVSRTDYDENPYIIEFVGINNDANLNFSAAYPQKESALSSASEFKISFAEPIALVSSSSASNVRLLKNGEEFANPIDIKISDVDPSTAIISFDNVLLYKTNSYSLIIDRGVFCNIDNSTILNNDIEIQYFGDSWNYFSLKRGLYPADGTEVIEIGNVNIPFNFPEGYGFKTTSSGPVEINADLYVGGLDGEKIGSYVFEASDADATILVGSVSTPLDAGQSYTLIVPKEQVVARNLTGIGSIEGWTNDDVVINLTTPSVDAINAVEINGEIPSQAESIDNVTLSVSPYKYKDDDYNYVVCEEPVIKLFENDSEIASYPIELAMVENTYVLRNKEAMNAELTKGKSYRIVLPAGTVTPDHSFLGKYGANKELSFAVEGTMPNTIILTYKLGENTQLETELPRNSAITLTLPTIDEYFEVKSVMCGDESLEANGDKFTTPELKTDTEVVVNYEYVGVIDITETSGIGTINDNDREINVSNDGSTIVVENLVNGDNVVVYTVNGMVIKSFVASKDVMHIDAPVGQVYIIRVNNGAVKLQH